MPQSLCLASRKPKTWTPAASSSSGSRICAGESHTCRLHFCQLLLQTLHRVSTQRQQIEADFPLQGTGGWVESVLEKYRNH